MWIVRRRDEGLKSSAKAIPAIGCGASDSIESQRTTIAPSPSIGKEWNEQAAGFAAYVTGKTVSEVAGIAVTESGSAADADLAASVTVGIGDFQALIAKAIG